MKKTVIICDVCKRDISADDKRYKFKRYENTYANYDNFEFNKWSKLDMCRDCYIDFVLSVTYKHKRSDNNADV